ncbi:MAG: glycosyl hydrolase [Eubacteriales bacterium]|nr:glycosyl hydrolase [Eubacteriales bacterium]
MITEPVNKNAIQEVRNVLDYLSKIEGKAIITGQHTQTMAQDELTKIHIVTGKYPALCGFELLSYSPNIKRETADEVCLREVDENKGTLEKAFEWAEKGGLITFTWHWFSPLGGRDKSFYARNTDFDAREALKDGTAENKAFLSDLDHMAELLKPFCQRRIPILWRPFHESEGVWFWWGAKGPETAKELFKFMYNYYTKHHHLDNLIWVWNSPLAEGYVGDEYCDIISRDMYPKPHAHSDFRENYEGLIKITPAAKGAAIGETGVIPDGDALEKSHTPWLWYRTWSWDFVLTEEYNGYDALKKLYEHSCAITLDKLPKLY